VIELHYPVLAEEPLARQAPVVGVIRRVRSPEPAWKRSYANLASRGGYARIKGTMSASGTKRT
jgi:hypothetical protein